MYVVSVVEQTLARLSDVIDSFSTSPQKTRCSFVCSEFEWRRVMTSLVYWLLSQKSIIKTGEGTHFICFTMVLFPDSPAPRKRKKKTWLELEAFRFRRRWSLWQVLSHVRQTRPCPGAKTKSGIVAFRLLSGNQDHEEGETKFFWRWIILEASDLFVFVSCLSRWEQTKAEQHLEKQHLAFDPDRPFFKKHRTNKIAATFFCSEDGILDRTIEPFRSSSRSNFPMLFFETHSIKELHEHDFWCESGFWCFCLARWQIG